MAEYQHIELEAMTVKQPYVGFGHVTINVRALNCPYPVRYGISVPRRLAYQVIAAIEGGAALSNLQVVSDVNGERYITCKVNIFGGTLKADLQKLGYL